MTDDKMREAFEARDDVAFDYSTYPDDSYIYEGTRLAFEDFRAGWQACAAQRAQEIEALRAKIVELEHQSNKDVQQSLELLRIMSRHPDFAADVAAAARQTIGDVRRLDMPLRKGQP